MNHRVTDSLDIEMRALEREQAGTVHQFRLEHLAIRLESGPVAVQQTIRGFGADRLAMVLDGGDTLVLRLLSRCRMTIAALCSIRWDNRFGWLVLVRASSGDLVLLKAWRAEVHLPASQ